MTARSAFLAVSMALAVSAGPGLAAGQDAGAAPSGDSRSGTAWSAEVAPNGTGGLVLDARQSEIVKQVSDYFNAAEKLQGRFAQTSADGKVMKGKFAMLRPGRFRFDYARPSLQVIISDGRFLAIQDHDLNNEDRVELDQTAFRLLLRSEVDIARDARILAVVDAGDTVSVTLQDKSPDTPGKIKLTFFTKPEFQLKEWITKDAQGLDTVVEVGNIDRTSDIDPKMFVIKPMGAAFNRR